MRIAIDCRMSGKSGIGTFLDESLPAILDSEHQFVLFGNKSRRISRANVQYIDCSTKTFSLSELMFFPKTLLNAINSCDVYFSPYCNIPGGIKIPVYTTIHDIVFLDIPSLAGFIGTMARKWFYKRAIRLSREIFTVSNFSRNRIMEKLGCRKKINVVYSGIPAYIEKEIPSTKKTDSILFIGNIKKHKGLSILIKAYERFCINFQIASMDPPTLLIVGAQENFRTRDKEVIKSIDSLNKTFSSPVKFSGFVDDECLHVLLKQAKVLVQPSLYEGFGVPPLMAITCGTKALISDIPVFKEIYENLPVTFFKSGNPDDLAEKLFKIYHDESEIPPFSHNLSYQNTGHLILKTITSKN